MHACQDLSISHSITRSNFAGLYTQVHVHTHIHTYIYIRTISLSLSLSLNSNNKIGKLVWTYNCWYWDLQKPSISRKSTHIATQRYSSHDLEAHTHTLAWSRRSPFDWMTDSFNEGKLRQYIIDYSTHKIRSSKNYPTNQSWRSNGGEARHAGQSFHSIFDKWKREKGGGDRLRVWSRGCVTVTVWLSVSVNAKLIISVQHLRPPLPHDRKGARNKAKIAWSWLNIFFLRIKLIIIYL